MPVYAPTPGFADRRRHPRALIVIIGAHAALVAAVMSAKMAVPIVEDHSPIMVDWIDPPKPPPPEPQAQPRKPQTNPAVSQVDIPPPIIPPRSDTAPVMDSLPIPVPDPGPIAGSNPDPLALPKPAPAVVRPGPRFVTPDWALRPPYPADKQRLEEEATLKLRLTIDERGRVIAVEPVGPADPSFLRAARKHLIASWRYKPATEDGRPVPSSTVITLGFELQ